MKITSFAEVDTALKRLCELKVQIAGLNGEVTTKCNEIKESYKSEIERFDSEYKYLEAQITSFCEDNKGEFATKRSKDFTFGKIGYKISKSVKGLPRLKDKVEGFINTLKSFKLTECIKYEETIDKDALAELDDATLVKLGLKREVKDNFRIEVKIESLENSNI